MTLVSILASIGGIAIVIALIAIVVRHPPGEFVSSSPEFGSNEPCWTEEIVSDGRFRYARSQCVHDPLMELDRRAAVSDFPVQGGSG